MGRNIQILLRGCLAYLLLGGSVILALNTTTSPDQWSAWENCVVYRVRFRDCSNTQGSACNTNETQNDALNYTTCPILSNEDIVIVTEERETSKVQKLTEIKNKTQAAVEAIGKQYEAAIATSSGFGYIAAICVTTIFLFPLVLDIQKLIFYCVKKNKISNVQNTKKKTQKADNKQMTPVNNRPANIGQSDA